jgi:uncharacterized protein
MIMIRPFQECEGYNLCALTNNVDTITGISMSFKCQTCGECCSSMGEVISIRDVMNSDMFRIWFTTTGEERIVTLDLDKRDLFYQMGPKSSMACPFLRQRDPGRVICTVHVSRPDLCRQYSCFRLLILNTEGKRAGRVLDKTRYMAATDSRIHEIWQRECRTLDIIVEDRWEDEIERIFTREGYSVVR